MAVARAPVGGGMTGIKVALIVFVCLTVASLAFAVILYTGKADMEAQTLAASEQATRANADLSKMRQQASEISRLVTGDSAGELEKMQETLKKAVPPILADEGVKPQRIAADAAVLNVLQGLFRTYQANAAALAQATADLNTANQNLADLAQKSEQRAKEFDAKTTEFQNRIASLEQANAANQQAWTQQVDDLKRRLSESTASATGSLARERQLRQDLEKQMAEAQGRSKELAEKLARFQPGMDNVSPEQIADGQVVRVVPVENIVYIGLGRRDRVTAGMPFTVYSSPRPGAPMREKATIEVRNVFDGTSEARVTSSKTTDPIVDGDLIANLVYDKNRKYRFVVAGDFDLNFDGVMDQPGGIGGQDVVRMIERWGGEVVPALDTSVDFVVLGAPPQAPLQPAANAPDDVKQRAADQAKTRQAFDALRSEAKSLSIPVLTRTQFLHFIGRQVPPKVPEDRVAAN